MSLHPAIVFILSCLVLVIAGSLLVKSFSRLACFLRMSEFVLAFVIMAFSTSLPELVVSVKAAAEGVPALALGNVIGSNVADLTLVAGIAAILGKGLRPTSKLIRTDAYWMVAISTLTVALMHIGRQVSRLDGIILICTFLVYIAYMFKRRKGYPL